MKIRPPNPFESDCPSRDFLELLGSKWSMLLLCTLRKKTTRTGELMRIVEGISQKMLTQTLRELEENGLVERISHPEVPPRVEYRLTPLGHSLSEVVARMEQWVEGNYLRVIEHQKKRAARRRV
jgi:DNA-binding HxlR family transcriptional regulator